MSFKIEYGDSCDLYNAIESCNDELKKQGYPIHFQFDNQPHDGFDICELIKDPRPTVVCLCGSTRFFKDFMKANYEETMKGNIVLSVGFYAQASEEAHGESVGITPQQKLALDQLHKRKIDLADEVLILNVGGYIGESTRSELEYAIAHGKTIRYKEPVNIQHS